MGISMRHVLSIMAILACTLRCGATNYYLAPNGSDANSGLSANLPWLSPDHAGLVCNVDTIIAAAGVYNAANFYEGKWGVNSCPPGHGTVSLQCATFDGCTVSSAVQQTMWIDQSYWELNGWQLSSSGGTGNAYGDCLRVAPSVSNPTEIHDIVIANNIMTGCMVFGIDIASYSATASIDYVAVVGNVVYGTSTEGLYNCSSGIAVAQPISFDSLPGTHIYIAGNFSIANVDYNPCASAAPTDGDGVILDTFDGQGAYTTPRYEPQAVVDNNMLLSNGGRGVEIFANNTGTAPFAAIYLRRNTAWGNNGDLTQNQIYCGEMLLNNAFNVQAVGNIAMPNATAGCGSHPIYSYYVGSSATTTNHIYGSVAYAASRNLFGTNASAGFSSGPNNITSDPDFANPVAPGAPNCTGKANTVDCMAAVIANFNPTNPAAAGYGYQVPSSTPVYDPLYPQWLCSVTNLPAGLVTPGCLIASATTGSVSGGTIQ